MEPCWNMAHMHMTADHTVPPTGKHKRTVLPIQAMAREGSQAAGERDEWAAEARAARRATATAEQLARSHAAELADARKAYQVRRTCSCLSSSVAALC